MAIFIPRVSIEYGVFERFGMDSGVEGRVGTLNGLARIQLIRSYLSLPPTHTSCS
jgi:hypothetical protein